MTFNTSKYFTDVVSTAMSHGLNVKLYVDVAKNGIDINRMVQLNFRRITFKRGDIRCVIIHLNRILSIKGGIVSAEVIIPRTTRKSEKSMIATISIPLNSIVKMMTYDDTHNFDHAIWFKDHVDINKKPRLKVIKP